MDFNFMRGKRVLGADQAPIRVLKQRHLGKDYVQRTLELIASVSVGVLVWFAFPDFVDARSVLQQANQSGAMLGAVGDNRVGGFVEFIHSLLAPIHQSIKFVVAIMSSLLALFVAQSVVRITNARQERLAMDISVADKEVLATLESLAEYSVRMTNLLQEHSAQARPIFTKLWRNKTKEYLGYIKNLSDLDADVESSAEVVFTRDLIGIAQESIWAVAVAEQQFWGETAEAEAYFESQKIWLSNHPGGYVRRILVLAEPHNEEQPETLDALGASKKMVTKHHALVESAKNIRMTGADEPVIDRYEWRVIGWADWIMISKAREDLVVYDRRYVRRGPLVTGATEQRRAHFRSNDSDVLKGIEVFEALWSIARPSKEVAATSDISPS